MNPFLKNTKPIVTDEYPESEESDPSRGTPELVVPGKSTPPAVSDLSASQISDSGFEIVDSTGIEQESNHAPSVKKRGKKGKK